MVTSNLHLLTWPHCVYSYNHLYQPSTLPTCSLLLSQLQLHSQFLYSPRNTSWGSLLQPHNGYHFWLYSWTLLCSDPPLHTCIARLWWQLLNVPCCHRVLLLSGQWVESNGSGSDCLSLLSIQLPWNSYSSVQACVSSSMGHCSEWLYNGSTCHHCSALLLLDHQNSFWNQLQWLWWQYQQWYHPTVFDHSSPPSWIGIQHNRLLYFWHSNRLFSSHQLYNHSFELW